MSFQGDNVLTGIYIAKKAGLIGQDEDVVIGNSVQDGVIEWVNAADDSPSSMPVVSESLALTGEVWQHLLLSDPNTALTLAPHTKVFGRCTPNDKVSIVSHFVAQGQTSLFCGDGGNDCGALKAAHVGIALSDAEASVVAPFTSLDKTITSVLDVLKEGRCALASALAAYKYMIMYGQVESINQVANAYLSITFTEWVSLYASICLNVCVFYFRLTLFIIYYSVGSLWMGFGRLRWLLVCHSLRLRKSCLQRGPQLQFSARTL